MITRFIDTAKLHAALMSLASLTSCLHHSDADVSQSDGAGDEPLGEMVGCALDNTSVFADDCRLERGKGGLIVIHHPNGTFRRFRLKPGGNDLATADGNAPAITRAGENGMLDVQVGEDRYHVPLKPASDSDGS